MEYMEYHEKKRLIKIIRNIIFIIFLGVNYHFYATSPSKAYKELDKYLRNKYGEEFVIGYMGRRKVNRREWYEAGIVYPKSYIGTVKENDIYYWGRGFAEIKGIGLDVGDNYGGVLLNESANEFYGKKLKELFGENILPVLNIRGEYKYTDFLKEYLRVEKTISGGIYIFGRVENDEDREWYRKQIFEFIKFMKQTGTFEDVSLGITIVDERILADNSLTYIRQLEKIKDVNTDFKILDEAFKNTSQESMDNKIANFSRSNIVDELNEYSGYLLSTWIVSPKRFLLIASEGDTMNYYKSIEDVIFSDEKRKLEGTIKEKARYNGYFSTEYKDNIKNGKSVKYNDDNIVVWTGTYVNNVLEGETKSYYNNGKLKEEGTYKNGLLEGKYHCYSEEGNISEIRNYKNGKLNGKVIYFSSGQKYKEIDYKDDNFHGVMTKYNNDGGIEEQTHYKNGKKNGKEILVEYDGSILEKNYIEDYQEGVEKRYFPSGKLHYTVNVVKNMYEGVQKWYNEDGKLVIETPYKNNKIHGTEKSYYEDGSFRSIYNYKNGKKDGEIIQYFKNGNIEYIVNYKNGKKDGEEKFYFHNGNLMYSATYKDGRKNGVVKVYDGKTGILLEEKLYIDGEFAGVFRKYNEDGSLGYEIKFLIRKMKELGMEE